MPMMLELSANVRQSPFSSSISLSLGPCSNGDIRLGDDIEGLRGRVEVCINMSWYTICHHGWSQREASVVCHQLGYSKHGI